MTKFSINKNRSGGKPKGSTLYRFLVMATVLPAALLSCVPMERRAKDYIAALPPAEPTGQIITEADLADLPPVVRKYFEYSQVLGKPKIASFGFTMKGRIQQSRNGKWIDFIARQYNFIADPARIYYIKADGFPMSGIDSYTEGTGRMHIKLFNLITVADSTGPEMDQSGLVTFLNDLMLCPLGYFSVPVEWEQVGDDQARISITHRGITASGLITFGDDGRILNWESDDRYVDIDGDQSRDHWSTPLLDWGEINGLKVPIAGTGIHNYDGEPYVYVELNEIHNLSWDILVLPAAP